MAENNNDHNENNNNNDNNDNNNNEDEQRGFLTDVLHQLATPLRVINQIRNLEDHLGLERTALFQDYDNNNVNDNDNTTASPDQQEHQEDNFNRIIPGEESSPEIAIMPTNSYSFGGLKIDFDDEEPAQNTDYTVGVVISKSDRPIPGSIDETKLIESLCKNQYAKYKLPETSMKSVERLLQSRGIMDTISGTETSLNKFDMKETFTVVFPEDKTLKRVKLAMNFDNSNIKSVNLLTDFRKVSIDDVALSCSWWNLHGHYFDKSDKKHSLGCDMNWSYLHFKNHVEEVLYNDVDKLFQEFEQRERGGALFFKLLTDVVLSSNEESLAALESTIKQYNIAKNGNDDILEATKILKAGSKSILAMRDDGSGKYALPESFVSDIVGVYTTSSVDVFNKRMAQYHTQLEINCLMAGEDTINTAVILNRTFKLADTVYTKLFNSGAWQAATLQKAASSFAIFWKNRCWNCKKENCNAGICKDPIDAERMEQNRIAWAKENNKDPNARRTSFKNNGSGEGRVKGKNPEWLPPTADENNKRIIYGKPYTWNGRKSWILDDTPDSGLRPPAINMNDDSSIPSQIPKDDDATVITQETGLSQDKQNEIRRLQANLTNMTVSLAAILKQE